MAIPRIIHQTWKTARVPRQLAAYVDTWRQHHPDWEYRLWTDRDNRQFIAEHYPKFLPVFDGYPRPIQRADAVRYFLLYHFGGLYIDLDFLCLQPIDELLAQHTCVVGLEPQEHCRQIQRERIVCNALMACEPKHPFFRSVIDQLPRYAQSREVHVVLETTGPFMLTNVYTDYPARDVTLLPSPYFYPLTKQQGDEFRRTGVPPVSLDGAYGVHLHLGTWWRRDPLKWPRLRAIRRRVFGWPKQLLRGTRQLLRGAVAGAANRSSGLLAWFHS